MCTEQSIFSGVFPRRRSVSSIQTTTFYDSDRRELLINFDRGPYFRRLTSIVRADNRQWFTRNRDDFRLKFRNAISNFIVFERNSNDNTSLCCAVQNNRDRLRMDRKPTCRGHYLQCGWWKRLARFRPWESIVILGPVKRNDHFVIPLPRDDKGIKWS